MSTTVEVLEVVRDFGPQRKIAKAEAAVADATIDNQIAESDLDVALKGQKLLEAQLRNDVKARFMLDTVAPVPA